MEARICNQDDVFIVQLSGKIDIEKSQMFRHSCLQNFAHKKVIFCMKNINFVGSSGIQAFFQTLDMLQTENKTSVVVTGVSPDFERLLRFTVKSDLKIFESVDVAIHGFKLSQSQFST